METIKFSRREIEVQFSECVVLKELISKLERDFLRAGKLICKIQINGLTLSEADEVKFQGTRISELDTVEVQVESSNTIVSETIVSLRDFIKNLKAEGQDLADLLREKRIEATRFQFTQLVNHIQDLTQAFLALRPNMKLGGEDRLVVDMWADAEKHLLKTLRELVVAYENQDFVLVSDILEYDLDNSLDNWQKLLTAIC